MIDVYTVRQKTQQIEQTQGPTAALAYISAELSKSGANAELWNFAGNIAMRSGDRIGAAERFAKAGELDSNSLEFPINEAIALSAAGRNLAAIGVLKSHEGSGTKDTRYCSVRANAARNAGDLAQAAHWYDIALRLDPTHKKAANGRARVALERAESDAPQRFERALKSDSGNADLWLGRAQSLDVQGDTAGARIIAQQLVDQAPAWTEGLKFLAQLKLGAGETDYTSHYAEAARRVPQDPNILNEWITQLAGLDHHRQAADVATKARTAFPDQPYFAFLEAIHTGSAGDDDRAEAIFKTLVYDGPDRQLYEARHRIRRREFTKSESLLKRLLDTEPNNIGAWALRSLVWRATGDKRANWLHEQENLYLSMDLMGGESCLTAAIPVLHSLHDNSPQPLGQSLRGGSQTRGALFQRPEKPLEDLRAAIEVTLEQYRANLPERDQNHPLLSQRDKKWRIAGSWSVRLNGGGDHHAPHIHPQGVLSSALYLELPEHQKGGGNDNSSDPLAGHLELGRPPADLRLDLPPLATIKPNVGQLALFPSMLYHGTRKFRGGRRMTVAFDVVSAEETP